MLEALVLFSYRHFRLDDLRISRLIIRKKMRRTYTSATVAFEAELLFVTATQEPKGPAIAALRHRTIQASPLGPAVHAIPLYTLIQVMTCKVV